MQQLDKLTKLRLLSYLEEAPKKCFFSVYNTMSKHESILIAMKYINELKFLIQLYDEKIGKNSNPISFEEFKKIYISKSEIENAQQKPSR